MTDPSHFTDSKWAAQVARIQALEEAARLCEEVELQPVNYSATDCARAIRALKDQKEKGK